MKYQNNTMTDVNIAYIGGGSRGWAWGFMTDLAREKSLSGTVRLYDINADAAQKNRIISEHLAKDPQAVAKWEYTVSASLEQALTGADFIVISILPGTFDEMDSDVHLPERHGIYQSVGDTAGPGGLVRALRTIPMFRDIAEAIRRWAPTAWVINYTNPMSVCVKTLYEVFPEIKAFGCCHEVFGTQKLLAAACAELLGEKDIPREDICVNVLGINHFTWFDSASYKGVDLLPVYRAFVDKYYDAGFDEPDKNWANSTFECAHRVKFDLFRRYGLIAAAGDRHLAEFMPGDSYLKNPDTVRDWKFGLTTVAWRKQELAKRLARSARLVSGEEQLTIQPTGEEGIRLILALCGLQPLVSNVNVPNTAGQIANLPRDAVVETNALFARDAVRPVFAGALPDNILALVQPHVENHALIVRAGLACDSAAALQALEQDPLVQGRLTQAEARALLRDMVHSTLAYLPDAWRAQL